MRKNLRGAAADGLQREQQGKVFRAVHARGGQSEGGLLPRQRAHHRRPPSRRQPVHGQHPADPEEDPGVRPRRLAAGRDLGGDGRGAGEYLDEAVEDAVQQVLLLHVRGPSVRHEGPQEGLALYSSRTGRQHFGQLGRSETAKTRKSFRLVGNFTRRVWDCEISSIYLN